MLPFWFGRRSNSGIGGPGLSSGSRGRRPRLARRPGIEGLEDRALLASAGVDVLDSLFAPNPVTIHQGDMVEWVWDADDESTTSVKGTAEQWDSGVLNTGAIFYHTFNNVGTFTYYSTTMGTDNGDGTASGMTGTITVLPPSPIMMIMVTPMDYSIPSGTTMQFMAMSMYADNSNAMEDVSMDVTWASSDPSVATVSNAPGSQGLVTAVAPGTATISVSLNGIIGSTPFTVTSPTMSSMPTMPAMSSMPTMPMMPMMSPTPTMPMMPTMSPTPTLAPAPSATPTPPPAVAVTNVSAVQNRMHMVTQITVDLNGPISAATAKSIRLYWLTMPGKKGSSAAASANTIKLKSVVYDAQRNEVMLKPKSPFRLAKLVQVAISGQFAISGQVISVSSGGR